MLSKILTLVGLAAAGLLLFIVTTVTPGSAGAAGILMVFVLSYVVLLCLFTFVIWASMKVFEKIGKRTSIFRGMSKMSLAKSYYYSSVIALGLVIILSLRSVGGVSIYELSLVILFVLFGCVYVARMTR